MGQSWHHVNPPTLSRSSSRKSSKVRSTTVKEAVRTMPKPKAIMPPVPPHQIARSSQDVEMNPSP